MIESKKIVQSLGNLPNTEIIYTKKPTEDFKTSYQLKVVGYKKFYLNGKELEDLTPEEQLILLDSSELDPPYTPSLTIAGIFKAREISKRSKSNIEAISKCNAALVKHNRNWLEKRELAAEEISKKTMKVKELEYYLDKEKELKIYKRKQNSPLAGVRNLKNKFLTMITRKEHGQPPISEKELAYGLEKVKKFRKARKAKPEDSSKKVLTQYQYNSTHAQGTPFGFLYESPEIEAHAEEYKTSTIALKILDGSAYKKAAKEISKNPRIYLRNLQEKNEKGSR